MMNRGQKTISILVSLKLSKNNWTKRFFFFVSYKIKWCLFFSISLFVLLNLFVSLKYFWKLRLFNLKWKFQLTNMSKPGQKKYLENYRQITSYFKFAPKSQNQPRFKHFLKKHRQSPKVMVICNKQGYPWIKENNFTSKKILDETG